MGKSMSIPYSDFVKGNFKKVNSVKDHPVLVFLKNSKKAHNVYAICQATKIKSDTVRSMLRKLVQKGIVTHKQPYFAFKR